MVWGLKNSTVMHSLMFSIVLQSPFNECQKCLLSLRLAVFLTDYIVCISLDRLFDCVALYLSFRITGFGGSETTQ